MFEEQDWLKIKRSIQDSAWGKKKKAGWQKKKILKNVQNSANAVVEMLSGTKKCLNTR